jgi:ornithine carbamoyltransferase
MFSFRGAQRSLSTCLHQKNFPSISALTPASLRELLDESHALQKVYTAPAPHPKPLEGMSVAMIFQKRSTRTRVSTETGLFKLGAHGLFLAPSDIQLGVNESVRDTAAVLSRFNDLILARVNENDMIQELEQWSDKPVINALCNKYHPLQTLADLMTLEQKWGVGGVKGKTVAWVGDGNNVLHDLMVGVAMCGGSMRIATPKGYEPADDVVAKCREECAANGGELFLTTVAADAVKGSDCVVTDTWISMGEEDQYDAKVKEFAGYQVTEQLYKEANESALFMHCLPRHKEEVDDEVFYGDRSVVWQEAENRMWTVMAVCMSMLGKSLR